MLKKLKEVYPLFTDSQSKEIWLNRVNYIISGNYEYVAGMLEKQGADIPCRPVVSPAELMKRYDKIVFYGAGDDATFYRSWFDEFDNNCVIGFCDRDENKQESDFFGYKVISPEELSRYNDAGVIITSTAHGDEIKEFLITNGIEPDRILDKVFPTLQGPADMYFDPEIIRFESSGEVFVDGGSFDLGTIKDLKRRTKVQRAYAFEADPSNVEKCKEGLSGMDETRLIPNGLWSKKDELRFSSTGDTEASFSRDEGNITVKVTSLDEVIPESEKVTFIKLDIEGSELEALKGAQNTIRRCRPKLAICIYHKPEDIYELPLFVKELIPEYRLYMRHYSNRAHETVMYAVL